MKPLHEIACAAFQGMPGGGDAQAGSLVPVYTVETKPAYSLVPFLRQGSLVGICRILDSGEVITVGPSRPGATNAAASVTGLTRDEAVAKAGPEAGEPLLVHDGPPGREAWMFHTPAGRVFIAGSGAYS